MGTVAYMSPEQARGLEVDARSDLFSLGVTLYELLTGQQPFKGKTTSDVLAALLEREPPPLAASRPEAPAELQRIVRRALAKPIEERYQTAREMIDDLLRLKQELAFATKLSGDSAVDEAGLIGKPARPSLDDRPASLTGEATPRNTSKLIFLIGYLRGRRLAAMALVALGPDDGRRRVGGALVWGSVTTQSNPPPSCNAMAPVVAIRFQSVTTQSNPSPSCPSSMSGTIRRWSTCPTESPKA